MILLALAFLHSEILEPNEGYVAAGKPACLSFCILGDLKLAGAWPAEDASHGPDAGWLAANNPAGSSFCALADPKIEGAWPAGALADPKAEESWPADAFAKPKTDGAWPAGDPKLKPDAGWLAAVSPAGSGFCALADPKIEGA